MITEGSIMQTSIDDLHEKVTILRATKTRDDDGNIIPSYSALRNVWAKVLPISAAIKDGYSAQDNEVVYRIVIRYADDLLYDDRIGWRGKILILTAPPYDAESRHVWTVIIAREMVENG